MKVPNYIVHNPNCCGSHCISGLGKVRVLPLGRIPDHGNLILCRTCYAHEMAWRRERNRDLGKDYQFQLPEWDSLKIYAPQPLTEAEKQQGADLAQQHGA